MHRDLKPSNILICLYDGKPVPKVIDFGLAKAMEGKLTDDTIQTQHGMLLGTPLYMKPGETFVGYRSDFDWGPVTRASQVGNGMRFQRLRNDPVNVDFTLTVDKRAGQYLQGRITQAGGLFEAVVEGNYDGVNLDLRMVRMLRGKPRHFEYSGQVVGALGKLHLRGIKVDGVATTGVITLQKQ